MAESKRWNRYLAVALVCAFLLACAGFAMAASSDSAAANPASAPLKAFCGKMMGKADPAERNAELQTVVDKLVADNVLTQEQADRLVSYLKTQAEQRIAQREEMRKLTPEQRQAQREKQLSKQGFLNQAVADQVITEDQAQAIQDALRSQHQASRDTALQNRLSELVSKGTINQSQADAVKSALDAQWQQRQAEMDKFRNLTPAERQTYMQQNRSQRQAPLEALVKNGTLTQEQADQICPRPTQGQGQGKNLKAKGMGRGCQGCPMNGQSTAADA